MGEFSNWKPITMKKIEDMEEPLASDMPVSSDGLPPTHFLRRNLDPKSYEFIFRVDDGDELQTADLYEQIMNNGLLVNTVDLENTPTRLMIEKKKLSHKKSKCESASQYTAFSGYLENEQQQINEAHEFDDPKVVSSDSAEDSPEVDRDREGDGPKKEKPRRAVQGKFQSRSSLQQKLRALKVGEGSPSSAGPSSSRRAFQQGISLPPVDIKDLGKGLVVAPLEQNQADLLKVAFKVELEDAVQNSPMKEGPATHRGAGTKLEFSLLPDLAQESLDSSNEANARNILDRPSDFQSDESRRKRDAAANERAGSRQK